MGDVRGSIEDFTARARYAREHGRGDERCGRCWSWAAPSPGSIATAAWRLIEQALALVPQLRDNVALQAHVSGSHAFQRILSRGWRDEDAETCRLSLDIAAARR